MFGLCICSWITVIQEVKTMALVAAPLAACVLMPCSFCSVYQLPFLETTWNNSMNKVWTQCKHRSQHSYLTVKISVGLWQRKKSYNDFCSSCWSRCFSRFLWVSNQFLISCVATSICSTSPRWETSGNGKLTRSRRGGERVLGRVIAVVH